MSLLLLFLQRNFDIALADSGAGTEALDAQALISLADAGAAVEQLDLQALIALAESALGAEQLDITSQTDGADAGAGAEAFALIAQLDMADAGAGADDLTVDTGEPPTPVALADDATGRDALDTFGLQPYGTRDYLPALIALDRRRRRSPRASGANDAGRGAEVISIAALIGTRDAARGRERLEIEKRDDDLELVALALAA